MVDFEKKWKNSPYDTAGMPLGAETVDYDKKDDVAQATVKDRYVEPRPLFSDEDEFEEKKIERTKYNPVLNNTAIQTPGHAIYKKHEEDIAGGLTDITDPPAKVDLDDPEEHEKIAKEDPKQTNKTELESKKVDHSDEKKEEDNQLEDNSNPDDLLALLKETDNDGK